SNANGKAEIFLDIQTGGCGQTNSRAASFDVCANLADHYIGCTISRPTLTGIGQAEIKAFNDIIQFNKGADVVGGFEIDGNISYIHYVELEMDAHLVASCLTSPDHAVVSRLVAQFLLVAPDAGCEVVVRENELVLTKLELQVYQVQPCGEVPVDDLLSLFVFTNGGHVLVGGTNREVECWLQRIGIYTEFETLLFKLGRKLAAEAHGSHGTAGKSQNQYEREYQYFSHHSFPPQFLENCALILSTLPA